MQVSALVCVAAKTIAVAEIMIANITDLELSKHRNSLILNFASQWLDSSLRRMLTVSAVEDTEAGARRA
jgi:hypothetical protein